jgi:hypothetical protein
VGNWGYTRLTTSDKVGGVAGQRLGGIGAFKCNVFVFDALAKGDVGVPLVNGHVPTTADWMNGAVSGYRPVTASEGLKAGDVFVSNGHMGIYAPTASGVPATVSASGNFGEHGAFPPVVHNSFGFRPEDSPRHVFRAK